MMHPPAGKPPNKFAANLWHARNDAIAVEDYLSRRKLPTPSFYIAWELGWDDKRVMAALEACGAGRANNGFWLAKEPSE